LHLGLMAFANGNKFMSILARIFAAILRIASSIRDPWRIKFVGPIKGFFRGGGKGMKRLLVAGLFLAMTPLMAAPPQAQKEEMAKISLKVGDTAPDFSLLSDQWKPVKLSEYRGKKNVFLAVYVLAFTGG